MTVERQAFVIGKDGFPLFPMEDMNNAMQECIQSCMDCHAVCLNAHMNHCLEEGGDHVEPAHMRLMRDCADICATTARFMLSGSPFHGHIASLCAEICTACAASCDELEGMEDCAELCRACAADCQAMITEE